MRIPLDDRAYSGDKYSDKYSDIRWPGNNKCRDHVIILRTSGINRLRILATNRLHHPLALCLVNLSIHAAQRK